MNLFDGAGLAGEDFDVFLFDVKLVGEKLDEVLVGFSLLRRGGDFDFQHSVEDARERGSAAAGNDFGGKNR